MGVRWSTIGDIARELARWWLEELRAILALAFPRIARAGRRPVLVRRDGGWDLALPDGRAIQELEPGRQSRAACDLAIPLNDCLVRRLSLPAASERKLQAMARLDIERGTPLKPADVYSGIRVEAYDRDARQLKIGQYVAKRERIAGLLEQAMEAGVRIESVVVFPGDDPTKSPVELGTEPLPRGPSLPLLAGSLAGLAACLSISALLLHASAQRSVLDRLDTEIAEKKALAKPVLDAVERDKVEAGRRRAIAREVVSYRPVVVVLNDVTRLMPDDVWITALNVAGTRVELTGYAPSAANLVKLIEASPSFSDPSLTSPIMYDRGQGKERFTLAFDGRSH